MLYSMTFFSKSDQRQGKEHIINLHKTDMSSW